MLVDSGRLLIPTNEAPGLARRLQGMMHFVGMNIACESLVYIHDETAILVRDGFTKTAYSSSSIM